MPVELTFTHENVATNPLWCLQQASVGLAAAAHNERKRWIGQTVRSSNFRGVVAAVSGDVATIKTDNGQTKDVKLKSLYRQEKPPAATTRK